MTVAAYYAWVAAGRPLSPAQPVADVIARMRAAYPKAAGSFSFYADAAHYQAAVPQDHTPYSTDGWPVPCQRWWVYATDVMHNPSAGVDCNALFAYWLGEARAGRFPGLKYLIWQAGLYDVRHGWVHQASAGHYDHIHLSFRTDWQTRGLGSWSLLPTPQPQLEENTVAGEFLVLTDGPVPDGTYFSNYVACRWMGTQAEIDALIARGAAKPYAQLGRFTVAEATPIFGPPLETLRGAKGDKGDTGPAAALPEHYHDGGITGPAK